MVNMSAVDLVRLSRAVGTSTYYFASKDNKFWRYYRPNKKWERFSPNHFLTIITPAFPIDDATSNLIREQVQ